MAEGTRSDVPDTDAASALAAFMGDLVSARESGEDVLTYVYRYDALGRKVPARFGPELYLAKIDGVPDFDEIRDKFGGGFYELLVRTRGGRMLTSGRVQIAGAPKDDAPERSPSVTAPPAPMSVAAAPPPLDEERLARTLVMALREVMPQAAPSPPPLSFADVLALAREMRGGEKPSVDPMAFAREMHETYQRGVNQGTRLAGGGRSIGDAIVEVGPSLAGVVDRAISTAAAARAGVPLVPAAGGDGAPHTAAAPSIVAELVVAGMVANALERESELAGEPDERALVAKNFADVLEVQYPASRLRELLPIPPAMLAAHLRRFEKQLPALASERLEPFLAEVLELLRASDETPAADAEAASS